MKQARVSGVPEDIAEAAAKRQKILRERLPLALNLTKTREFDTFEGAALSHLRLLLRAAQNNLQHARNQLLSQDVTDEEETMDIFAVDAEGGRNGSTSNGTNATR